MIPDGLPLKIRRHRRGLLKRVTVGKIYYQVPEVFLPERLADTPVRSLRDYRRAFGVFSEFFV